MRQIELTKVSKHFGKLHVLTDVTWTVPEKTIVGVIGRNGAGKSTLFDLIAGRLFPSSGKIQLDGVPVLQSPAAGNDIYLMSDQNIFPKPTTVADALRIMTDFYPGFDTTWAHQLTKQFGLTEKWQLTDLSTGGATIMRMILALCVPSAFVFLDEPTLGMDATYRKEFYRALVATYADRPRTFVISTHLIDEVAGMMSQVMFLDRGRKRLEAATDDLQAAARQVSGPAASVAAYLGSTERAAASRLGNLLQVTVLTRCRAAGRCLRTLPSPRCRFNNCSSP